MRKKENSNKEGWKYLEEVYVQDDSSNLNERKYWINFDANMINQIIINYNCIFFLLIKL